MVTEKEVKAAVEKGYCHYKISQGKVYSVYPTGIIDGRIVTTRDGMACCIYELYLTVTGAQVVLVDAERKDALKKYEAVVEWLGYLRHELEVDEIIFRKLLGVQCQG
jgi:hypothetical protein